MQISVKKQHTMVCKACNSHVHNTNDMTLVHLNECFNGKFNDDHCRVQNYLYCFSCKTVTPVHNNNNSCKAITLVHNVTSVVFESKDDPTQMTKIVIYNYILYYIQKTMHSKLICTNVHS